MKLSHYLMLITVLIAFLHEIRAQGVSINDDGAAPHGSAALDIQSTTKGLLVPRLTFGEMFSVSDPATGLLVFCTSFNQFYYYDGTTWKQSFGGGDENWILDEGNLYSGNAGNVGIGIENTLATHKLTIENSTSGNVLRLVGNGQFGSLGKFSFGDGDYVYLEEFADDKLMVFGNSELGMVSGYKVSLISYYSNLLLYSPGGGTAVNGDGTDPHPSAALDVKSTNRGMLIPRLTQEQIQAIGSPADGLQAYNTDDGKLYIFVASTGLWKEVSYGAGLIAPPFENCGDMLTDDRDGQLYPTVEINGQCWLAKNLNYGTFTSGYPSNNSVVEKSCWYNNTSYCDTYGGLYQWNEMMNYTTTEGAQGICMDGWHIPTDGEVYSMENALDPAVNNPNATGYRGSDIGGQLKETGYTHWYGPNSGATNSSGFTALAGGYRTSSFVGMMSVGRFWTSTHFASNPSYAYLRELYYGYSLAYRGYTTNNYFHSVRCIKD